MGVGEGGFLFDPWDGSTPLSSPSPPVPVPFCQRSVWSLKF